MYTHAKHLILPHVLKHVHPCEYSLCKTNWHSYPISAGSFTAAGGISNTQQQDRGKKCVFVVLPTTTMETNIKASDDIAKDRRWYSF